MIQSGVVWRYDEERVASGERAAAALMEANIAIVDDDPQITQTIAAILSSERMTSSAVANSGALFDLLKNEQIDLIILDINLGSENGIDIARRLRAHSNVPIIMVTGRGETQSQVAGLDAGADDYITKPFTKEALLARIRSVLRRSRMGGGDGEGKAAETVDLADLHFDAIEQSVSGPSGQKSPLTYHESLIMGRLLQTPNQPVSRQELSRFALERDWQPKDRSLDVHMSNLRSKLRAAEVKRIKIRSARGQGYVISALPDGESGEA